METKKIILYIAMSLDGYIAGKNGDVDWLPSIGEDEDFAYNDFINDIDTIIMGKRTYDLINNYGDFPYKNKKCYVFTKEDVKNTGQIEFVNKLDFDFISNVKKNSKKDIWLLGGSSIVDSFIKKHFIDELIISIIPIILGGGIPLFNEDNPKTLLELNKTIGFSKGVAQIHYKVKSNKESLL